MTDNPSRPIDLEIERNRRKLDDDLWRAGADMVGAIARGELPDPKPKPSLGRHPEHELEAALHAALGGFMQRIEALEKRVERLERARGIIAADRSPAGAPADDPKPGIA